MTPGQKYGGKASYAKKQGKRSKRSPRRPNQSQHADKLPWLAPYGRTGDVQALHIQLDYADGTKGEINLTSPQIAWGDDIDKQYYFLRQYLKSQHKALGIVRYHAHCASVQPDGTIKILWSWRPFDLITQNEVRS